MTTRSEVNEWHETLKKATEFLELVGPFLDYLVQTHNELFTKLFKEYLFWKSWKEEQEKKAFE